MEIRQPTLLSHSFVSIILGDIFPTIFTKIAAPTLIMG